MKIKVLSPLTLAFVCTLFLHTSSAYAQQEILDPDVVVSDNIYGNKLNTPLYIFGNTNPWNGPYIELVGNNVGGDNSTVKGSVSYVSGQNVASAPVFVDANTQMGHTFFTKVYLNGSWQPINRLTITNAGNIGIGSSIPSAKLEIAENTSSLLTLNKLSSIAKSEIAFKQQGATKWSLGMDFQGNNTNSFFIKNSSSTVSPFIINDLGQVSIGDVPSTPTGYNLFVTGGILTEKVKVAVKTTGNWADYVFADDYKLTPLSEVEAFVRENKHLPEIPSAQEVVEQGIDVAQMDALLLKKIEELTLHMIELQKQNEQLKSRVQTLER